MAQTQTNPAAFQFRFTYTDAVLSDFEAFYRSKATVSVPTRIVCGVIGTIGALYFGFQLYREGLSVARVGYLIICSLMILIACSSRRRSGSDETLKKYRKYYLNQRVSFRVDETGIEMQLEKQKTHARSKFREIYGLFETEQCFYLVIKGKAYYIISKRALPEKQADALRHYLERNCKKKFQAYAV